MEKNNIQRAQDTYSEIKSLKDRLLVIIYELGLLFSECEMIECSVYSNKLYSAVKSFNLLTPDYSKLISAIETLKKHIPKSEAVNAALIGHLMNNVSMGYYSTDIAHVKLIKRALKFPDSTINVLAPCCGCGLALEALTSNTNSVTYGIEIDEARDKEAESRLYRVGFGSYFHSRVSREAFHLLFLNPPCIIKEIMRRENDGTVTETRVNRMLFNILTPDGVKHLA